MPSNQKEYPVANQITQQKYLRKFRLLYFIRQRIFKNPLFQAGLQFPLAAHISASNLVFG